MKHPNIVIVFADQLRYQATGFAGDPNVKTPHLDRLAAQSLNFTKAVSGCPVCSPARASLLTGRYPDKHGVFVNDVCLNDEATSLAQACASAGYRTAYIGKWHLDGHGRSNYIPPERRQGFDYWKVLECTHNYNRSAYYAGDDPEKVFWEGYDAIEQTDDAVTYIHEHEGEQPFLLVVSWGTPHNPYNTAPEKYRQMYDPDKLELRPNVPAENEAKTREDLAGYYAHVSALDDQVGKLLNALDEEGISDDTVFMFWSDHGDMIGSQGMQRKQRPWDESILVPLLIRYPAQFGQDGREIDTPINTPDLMPTLLSMSGVSVPDSSEGNNYCPFLSGEASEPADGALIACYHPFGEYQRERHGGREYRGIRTRRHTLVLDRSGPWLLYDNEADPYQLENLAQDPEHAALRDELVRKLEALMAHNGDQFLSSDEYLAEWGYEVDEGGTVPYAN